MRRLFTKKQRMTLRILSGNLCSFCGVPLKRNFHADHKIPFSKSGKTILRNGLALCPTCNLKKGAN